MEAHWIRVALIATVLLVSMGARHQTANFTVEAPNAKLAQAVATSAERFRHDLAAEWLGKAMPDWSQPCNMSVRVGPNLGAGGSTNFVFNDGHAYGWQMAIQGSRERLFDSVLPHEILHTILASHFRQPLPRWADEGAASVVEHVSERTKHRKMLVRFLRGGQGIAFGRMFAMKQYPPDMMPRYAQGHSLATFLIQKGGKRKYIDFIGDGMSEDRWSEAIRRHYGIADTRTLQETWLAWVAQGWPDVKPRPSPSTDKPDPAMLADAGRRVRPEPNLIHRVPRTLSKPYAPGSTIAPSSENSGWHAVGSRPVTARETQVIRSQVTRPPPFEQSRQIILEWGGR